jgi:NAD(P)-dependent dehydrogenase (short-subunit alcohol dehydrogenase family)
VDLQLTNRVGLVVGGAGYIGSAISSRLRDEGATVVVASRSTTGDGREGTSIDASDPASVRTGVARVLAAHGRIDVLVVTAAPSAQTLDPARNSEPDAVLEQFDAKALAFLRVANEVTPGMRSAGYGRIVVLSGQNALVTGSIVGSVRNAATVLIAKNLADSLAGTGVRVNSVSPGIVRDEPATAVEPGRPGESSPQQIADLVAFLASPLCGMSGESIAVGHRVLGVASY